MKKTLSSLTFIALLLTSCGYKGNHLMYQNGDVVFNSSDNYLIELNYKEAIKGIISSGDSIAIYYGLEGCSSCEEIRYNLNHYVKDNGQQIYYVSSSRIDLNTLELGYSDFKVSSLYLFDDGQLFKTYNKEALNNPKMIKNNLSRQYKKSNAYIFNDVSNFTSFISSRDCNAFIIKRTEKDANDWYCNNYKNKLGDDYTAIYYIDEFNPSLEKYGVYSNYYFAYLECSGGKSTMKDFLVYYM